MDFEPTQQQKDVAAFFKSALADRSQTTSIFLNAVAGSGKSSTIMLLVEELKDIERNTGRRFTACSVSFNTNIRDANAKKLQSIGSRVQAKTTNQLGRSILVAAAKSRLCTAPQQLDNDKYRSIIEGYMKSYRYDRDMFRHPRDYGRAITAVCTLIDAVRATRLDPIESNLIEIILHYDLSEKIDIEAPWWGLVSSQVRVAIDQGILDYDENGIHDFGDQISLPLYLDLAAPTWDVIFIDEAQDLNRARLEMLMKVIKPGGVLFFVGDPSQAIQGFTFSDTDSVGTITRTTNAIEFPLSVCWRCDADIIKLAQVLVPYIEARLGAGSGTVETVDELLLVNQLQPGDAVICRINAPLVRRCIETIRAGKPAVIRGRDIGKNVISLLESIISDSPFFSFQDLDDLIRDYIAEKISSFFGKDDAERKSAEWEDKGATLRAFLDGYMLSLRSPYDGNIEVFKAFINEKFSDNGKDAIVFSTIHKVKGEEFDCVFVLETDLLPHPAAVSGWQLDEEYNLIYVAVTRAKHKLFFVGRVPACLLERYNEIKGIDVEPVVLSETVIEEIYPEVLALPAPAGQVPGEQDPISYTQNLDFLHSPELDQNGELPDSYIESVLAPLKKKSNAGRSRKPDLDRVNVKLSKDQIELTKEIDRSKLLRVLLASYLGEDGGVDLTTSQRSSIDQKLLDKSNPI